MACGASHNAMAASEQAAKSGTKSDHLAAAHSHAKAFDLHKEAGQTAGTSEKFLHGSMGRHHSEMRDVHLRMAKK